MRKSRRCSKVGVLKFALLAKTGTLCVSTGIVTVASSKLFVSLIAIVVPSGKVNVKDMAAVGGSGGGGGCLVVVCDCLRW